MKLEPCPKCGYIHVEIDFEPHHKLRFWVICSQCFTLGISAKTKQDAVDQWNRGMIDED
jgi:Lar family restriction alleviation protein